MRVDLPRKATGQEIAEAIEKAASRIGFSCDLRTNFKFVPGSVKEVPETHLPKLSKRTGILWGKTELLVGTHPDFLGRLAAESEYTSLEVVVDVPDSDPYGSLERVRETSDRLYVKAQPYLKEFLEAFFEELRHSDSLVATSPG